MFREITVKGIDTDQFVVKQEFYASKDGTKVRRGDVLLVMVREALSIGQSKYR